MQADGTRRSRELDEGTRTCHLNRERARGPRTDGLLRVEYSKAYGPTVSEHIAKNLN